GAVVQVFGRLAGWRAELEITASVFLREHGSGHPDHEPPRARRPQPGGLHVPPARGAAPPGEARRSGAGQAQSTSAARLLETLACPAPGHRKPGTVARQEPTALSDPDG